MSRLLSVQNLSLIPLERIGTISKLKSKNLSPLDSGIMRLQFFAQVIVSAIALPLITFTGLLECGLDWWNGENNEAFSTLGNLLKYHLICVVPGSFIAAIAPLDLAKNCFAMLYDSYCDNATKLTPGQVQELSILVEH